jgi:hypothetical protein
MSNNEINRATSFLGMWPSSLLLQPQPECLSQDVEIDDSDTVTEIAQTALEKDFQVFWPQEKNSSLSKRSISYLRPPSIPELSSIGEVEGWEFEIIDSELNRSPAPFSLSASVSSKSCSTIPSFRNTTETNDTTQPVERHLLLEFARICNQNPNSSEHQSPQQTFSYRNRSFIQDLTRQTSFNSSLEENSGLQRSRSVSPNAAKMLMVKREEQEVTNQVRVKLNGRRRPSPENTRSPSPLSQSTSEIIMSEPHLPYVIVLDPIDEFNNGLS